MVVLGDACLNYCQNIQDSVLKEKMHQHYNCTIFCIHGNHEIRPSNISTYKTKVWNNGLVWYEEDYPNILFAKDGEIYDLNGYKCMPIGGAYSVDKWYRIYRSLNKNLYFTLDRYVKFKGCSHEKAYQLNDRARHFIKGTVKDKSGEIRTFLTEINNLLKKEDKTWWADEEPDDDIKKYVEKQLSDNEIDIIFSHTSPLKYQPTEAFLDSIDQSSVDNSTEVWLDSIESKFSYKKWYCGHYHIDKSIDKVCFMFNDVRLLKQK